MQNPPLVGRTFSISRKGRTLGGVYLLAFKVDVCTAAGRIIPLPAAVLSFTDAAS